jgi:hypothetical protein
MDRCLALIVPASLVTAAILFAPAISVAKPEYSRRTKNAGSVKGLWDINDAGSSFATTSIR